MNLNAKITKLDDDARLVFGFASVAEIDGQPVIDSEGDVIDINELEKAAYNFVENSRVGGEMHSELGGATLIESFVITPAKAELLNIENPTLGWFIGLRVTDDALWQKIKSGTYRAFSIGGRAVRRNIDDEQT